MISAFDIVAEPARRRILDLLSTGELAAGDLADALPISQPGVSKHLKVLREAGLVSVRVDAQRRLYRLRPEGLREIEDWIAPYRRFWSDQLDALENHLNRET
jgi:DNA-binding transcriptional ArsR family regulator